MARWLSIGEVAERLGVSPNTVRRMEASGELVPRRTIGGQRRYLEEDVAAFENRSDDREGDDYSEPTAPVAAPPRQERRKEEGWSLDEIKAIGLEQLLEPEEVDRFGPEIVRHLERWVTPERFPSWLPRKRAIEFVCEEVHRYIMEAQGPLPWEKRER